MSISVLASASTPTTRPNSRSSGPSPCTAASTTAPPRNSRHRRGHRQQARAFPDVSHGARGPNRQEPRGLWPAGRRRCGRSRPA